jgi:transposase-like protein
MTHCKYCGCTNLYKYGKYKGIQKYKCKTCGKVFSDKVDTRYNYEKYDIEKRKMAISMYINNVGIRSIERILNVSNVLVLNWIKNAGKNLELIINRKKDKKDKKDKKIEILEMDELYSYIKKTK